MKLSNSVLGGLSPKSRAAARAKVEFLPAALEILETPASPVGRAIAGTLMAFFAIAVLWATFGYVDIIAVASGKVVPTGRTKTVQPLEPGIVTSIKVRDGDTVAAGQVLVELERTVAAAERARVFHDYRRARLDVARLLALRDGLDHGGAPVGFAPPTDIPLDEIARTRAAMETQAAAQIAKVSGLEQQIAQKSAEASALDNTIAKLRAGLPLIEETAAVRQKAMQIEYGNRIAHLDAQLRLSDQKHELQVQERRIVEVTAARQALERSRDQATSEYANKLFSDLADAQVKVAQLSEDLIKADQKLEERVLRAPVDGKVQQLAVHTVGGVVTPAQPVMMIVPADSKLEVEAMILNKDIGFVQAGQPAEIKIDTFNFTRYGLLHGKVVDVSQDAIVRDRPAEKGNARQASGSLSDTSEPQGQELVYAARVALDSAKMQIDNRLVDLAPGMAVTVEVKTSERRIIEYILSPLMRYKQESLRER